jgi:hypothetical protein
MSGRNCQYIRDTYGVPVEIGRRVTVYGKPGIIVADRGHYIGVNFDLDKPGKICNAHPTDQVVYLEMGKIRKMTRSQERYQKYLGVSECFESFWEFLRYESDNRERLKCLI